MPKDDRPVVCLATGNEDKRHELKRAFFTLRAGEFESPHGPPPDENGDSYEANARIKAEAYSARHPEWIVVAEDSGLEIPALPGMLGLETGPFLRKHGLEEGLNLVLDALKKLTPGVHTRRARFVASIAVAVGGRGLASYTRDTPGIIATECRGKRPFGFDPIFVPEGACATLAEMRAEDKADHSPRTRAAEDALPLIRALHAEDAVLSTSTVAARHKLLDTVRFARIAVIEGISEAVLLECARFRSMRSQGATLAILDDSSWPSIAHHIHRLNTPALGEAASDTPASDTAANEGDGAARGRALRVDALNYVVVSEGLAGNGQVDIDTLAYPAAAIVVPVGGVPMTATSDAARPTDRAARRELKRLRHGLRNLFSANWTRDRRVRFFEPLYSYGEALSHKTAHLASLLALVDLASVVLAAPGEAHFETACQVLRVRGGTSESPWTDIATRLGDWCLSAGASSGVLLRVARDYLDAFAALDSQGLEMTSSRGARTWWGPFSGKGFKEEWKVAVGWHTTRFSALAHDLHDPEMTPLRLEVVLHELRIELSCLDTYIRRLREAMIVY